MKCLLASETSLVAFLVFDLVAASEDYVGSSNNYRFLLLGVFGASLCKSSTVSVSFLKDPCYCAENMGSGASCGRREGHGPAMKAIEEQHRQEAQRAEAQRRAEELEQERQALAERLRIEEEAARKAAEHAAQLEREKQAQAERIRAQEVEAQSAAQNAQQLEREKQEQVENARREQETAQRAAQAVSDLQEEMRKKEAEIKDVLDAQNEAESKWRSGIRPVEWPSQEKYEETKRRYYTEGKFHLAITGISGTGKSSLINAFRGIWDDDEGAAMTDIVESTSVVTPYPDPNPDRPFVWFDVPGSGTLACSDWTYFNDQGLYIFDAIIVLFNDRFTASDIAILKNSERYNIPTYIVRSKSDVHIDNIVRRKKRGAGPGRDPASILYEASEEYITRTQENVRSNLMKNDPPMIRSKKFYAVSRDTLTTVVRGESLKDILALNEVDLLKDLLQDGRVPHSTKKSWGTMADLMMKIGVDIVRFSAK
ncbi:interferon-inducible GTPase-domain-containing protein [Armillaria novae-zelandiae]|uniref:Interferon-inducible GTPase-domain-containing protein n=1 Tax=Armillaria novae-zelandiae TaxID=153914 RepID=A0AA39UBQ6_9AGAR|nr:interferon-inducible GTPase-domain-containing protein [Armillaria novae-zelandiae]